MKVLELTRGRITMIDDDDYERVSQYKWTLVDKGGGRFYARRNVWVPGEPSPRTNKFHTYKRNGKEYAINGHYTTHSLHRLIMNPPDDMFIDHIDGNGLNNQKSNLRIVTPGQNLMNTRVRKKSNSGVKGVTWDRQTRKWRATITHKGKMTNLGRYEKLEDAVVARQKAEKEMFGNYS